MILANARLGDRVVDVRIVNGSIDEVAPTLEPAGEPTVDLGGRWILPGLWDQHTHFGQWAMSRRRFDVSGAASAREAADIARRRPRPGAGEVLVGVGFRDGLWPDAPTAAILDAAVPDAPVVLIAADLHCCWLNTAALARFGVPDSDGLLREDACFAVVRALDDVAPEVLDDWAAEAGRAAAARGVVGIVDLEMAWGFDDWRRRMATGFDGLRVRAGVYPQYLDRAIAEGLRTGDRVGDLLEVGPFKIIIDGSLNTRTAYCHDPYPGLGGDRGLLTVPPDELIDWLRRATAAGLAPAVHAIGDAANTVALDALEVVGAAGSRIEHAQLLAASDVPRFAQLGVTASVQPEQAMDDRDVADRYWAGRTDRAFALAALSAAGARLAMGSDAPVAPLDPWVTIAAAVWRTRGREPWHPEQRISAEMAIASSVQSAVAVGQLADLVVVDIDPLAATDEQLRAMPVAATLLGGSFTHNAVEHSAT